MNDWVDFLFGGAWVVGVVALVVGFRAALRADDWDRGPGGIPGAPGTGWPGWGDRAKNTPAKRPQNDSEPRGGAE